MKAHTNSFTNPRRQSLIWIPRETPWTIHLTFSCEFRNQLRIVDRLASPSLPLSLSFSLSLLCSCALLYADGFIGDLALDTVAPPSGSLSFVLHSGNTDAARIAHAQSKSYEERVILRVGWSKFLAIVSDFSVEKHVPFWSCMMRCRIRSERRQRARFLPCRVVDHRKHLFNSECPPSE